MAADPVPARMYTNHLFWDKKATHTDDVDSFLPLHRLAEYAEEGRIGSVSPRFYGVPTDYSQNRTINQDAPQILEWCREDGVDVVLLSAPLTGLPSDRESDGPTSGRKRPAHGGHGFGPGHC